MLTSRSLRSGWMLFLIFAFSFRTAAVRVPIKIVGIAGKRVFASEIFEKTKIRNG